MNQPVKCVDQNPAEPGRFEVIIDGVQSMLPMFARFDGESWDFSLCQQFMRDPGQMYWFPQ